MAPPFLPFASSDIEMPARDNSFSTALETNGVGGVRHMKVSRP